MANLSISYDEYLDRILGGWVGKSIGGAVGARFECQKRWIDLDEDSALPDKLPPNDDLDLQVLWLSVLEKFGAAMTSDDLARAWLEGCWYPFNEYGIFRKNWMLGLHPPHTGRVDNGWWETGMGCPIRSEIWGYVFPGAPELAARYAEMDGTLDHTEQSVGAEKMFAAMAADAFFGGDIFSLVERHFGYLPEGTPIRRASGAALECVRQGMPLRESRERVLLIAGNVDPCDSQVNVPFTLLALAAGGGDMMKTILAANSLGYDTDCTAATAGAFVGQMLGYRAIPERWRKDIGDELVMGIQYRREEMTLSALARDTARVGVGLAGVLGTGVSFGGLPALAPIPEATAPAPALKVEYPDGYAAAPGDALSVHILVPPELRHGELRVTAPDGWRAEPAVRTLRPETSHVKVMLSASTDAASWPMTFRFKAEAPGAEPREFAVLGASAWTVARISSDSEPSGLDPAAIDLAAESARVARALGREPVLWGRTQEVDFSPLGSLEGEHVIWLVKDFESPDERNAAVQIGRSCPAKVWINGEAVISADRAVIFKAANDIVEQVENGSTRCRLKAGRNRVVVRLEKTTDILRFRFALRHKVHVGDYMVDLLDCLMQT